MVFTKKNVGSFTYKGFYRKRDCVTTPNYTGSIVSAITKFSFVVHFSNTFCHRSKAFPKGRS